MFRARSPAVVTGCAEKTSIRAPQEVARIQEARERNA